MRHGIGRKDSFEYNSTVLFFLMMCANVTNYLFQIIVGRMLTVEEYSVVNTLVSITTVFSVPCVTVTLVVAKYVALYQTGVKKNGEKDFIIKICIYSLVVGFIIIMVGICGSSRIATLLKLREQENINLALVTSAMTLVLAIMRGIQQGIQEFWGYGIQNFLTSFLKLIGSVLLIYLGFLSRGVMWALLIATFITIIYCCFNLRTYFGKLQRKGKDIDQVNDDGSIIKLMFSILTIQLCVSLLTNGDILLVKGLFDEAQAGLYSSAMVIGKIAMYVSGAVVTTMFPMVAKLSAEGKSTKKMLLKSNLYGGGMAILCSLGMILFGKTIIGILFGEKYLQAFRLLPCVCVCVIPVTFLTVISNYVAAIGKVSVFMATIAIGLLLCMVYARVFHKTVQELFYGIGIILTLITMINLIYLFKRGENRKID